MIHLTAKTAIQIAIEPVDFRKQIDGLVSLCQNRLKQETQTGVFFVFINRAKTMIRILAYENNGYWLATKRLSRGRYRGWPKAKERLSQFEAAKLVNLLKGTFEEAE
jgi:hypothetical protein